MILNFMIFLSAVSIVASYVLVVHHFLKDA